MKHPLVLNLLRHRSIMFAILVLLVSLRTLMQATYQSQAVSPLAERSSASADASSAEMELANATPGAISYAALIERPIFSRTRRPYVPPPSEAPSAAELQAQPEIVLLEPQLTLQGIFIRGSIRRALVLIPDNPAATWLNEGDHISVWRLAEIKPNQLILQAGKQRRAIELYVEKP